MAAGLLKNTASTIKVIYRQVGYSDGVIFTRTFHRYFGPTPTELRRSDTKIHVKMVEPLLR